MYISWTFLNLLQTSTTAEQVNLSTISIDFLFSRNLLFTSFYFHIHSAKKESEKNYSSALGRPLGSSLAIYFPMLSSPRYSPLWLPFSLFIYRRFLTYSKRPPSIFFPLLNYHLTHVYLMDFPEFVTNKHNGRTS